MQSISKVWWPMSGKVSSFKLFPVFSVLFILCREDDEHFVGHARYADTVRNASQSGFAIIPGTKTGMGVKWPQKKMSLSPLMILKSLSYLQ